MKEDSIAYMKSERRDGIVQYIGMYVLMISQIWSTYEVEDGFRS